MDSFLVHVDLEANSGSVGKLTSNAAFSFLRSHRAAGDDDVTENSVSRWVAEMILDNLNLSTRRRYFSRIRSLYREWLSGPGADPFLPAAPYIDSMPSPAPGEAAANLELVGRLLAKTPESLGWQYINIFLYLLYDPRASLADVVDLKFDSPVADCAQIADVVEAMRLSGRRKYVFGLDQGRLRLPGIISSLVSELHSLLLLAGMHFSGGFSRESVTAIWIAAALKAGVSFEDIRSIVGKLPAEYSFLGMFSPKSLSVKEAEALIRRVADTVSDKASRWFVMRMRPRVTPKDIQEAVEEKAPVSEFGTLSYYCPTFTEVRRLPGKKTVRKETPWLPGILFFRMRSDKVGALMARIGDLGWCYKWTNRPGAAYCTVSAADMRMFQRHVGQLTPDVRMEIVTRDRPLDPGTEVRISGGGFMEGHLGVIKKVKNTDGTRTYTLTLSAREYATWTVNDIDEAFLEEI